jgi:hypothetical protein
MCETGTSQQVAELPDSYMMMMNYRATCFSLSAIIRVVNNTLLKTGSGFCGYTTVPPAKTVKYVLLSQAVFLN